MPISLRPYQREAIGAIVERRKAGVNSQLVVLPTGTGKTLIFLAYGREAGARTLVLVHREELLDQALEKAGFVWPEAHVGVVRGKDNTYGTHLTVASVPTLAQERRLAEMPPMDVVVVDEAHHVVAPTYRRILDRARQINPRVLILGVTATCQRADRQDLSVVFKEIVYEKSLLEMIEARYLVDLRYMRLKTDVRLDGIRLVDDDYSERDLARVVNTAGRNAAIVAAAREHLAGRKHILVFCVDVAHARAMADAFRAAGISAEAIYGELPLQRRKELLQGFRGGFIRVLTNCQVLTEGYDAPFVDALVMARPTRSQLLYMQMLGRGTRLYPGKPDCLVLDVADVAAEAARPLGFTRALGLSERVAREMSRKTLLDAYTEEKGAKAVSAFAWVQDHKNRYFLSLPNNEFFALVPVGTVGNYGAYLYAAGSTSPRPITERPLPLEWAQGVAETYVRERRYRSLGLVDRGREWREAPANENQLNFLKSAGVEIPSGLTKGQASDMISLIKALQVVDGIEEKKSTPEQVSAIRSLLQSRAGQVLLKKDLRTLSVEEADAVLFALREGKEHPLVKWLRGGPRT